MTKVQLQSRIDELERRLREVSKIDAYYGSFEDCLEYAAMRLPCSEVEILPSGDDHIVVLKWR